MGLYFNKLFMYELTGTSYPSFSHAWVGTVSIIPSLLFSSVKVAHQVDSLMESVMGEQTTENRCLCGEGSGVQRIEDPCRTVELGEKCRND